MINPKATDRELEAADALWLVFKVRFVELKCIGPRFQPPDRLLCRKPSVHCTSSRHLHFESAVVLLSRSSGLRPARRRTYHLDDHERPSAIAKAITITSNAHAIEESGGRGCRAAPVRNGMGTALITTDSYSHADPRFHIGAEASSQAPSALPTYPTLQLIPQYQWLSERCSRNQLGVVARIPRARAKEEAQLKTESTTWWRHERYDSCELCRECHFGWLGLCIHEKRGG